MKTETSANMGHKLSFELLISILDAMVLTPHTGLSTACKQYGASDSSAFRWQAESAKDEKLGKTESPFLVEWLGLKAYFHRHVVLARRLSIQQIDAKVRQMAVSGTREPMVNQQTGKPMWTVDPQLASDAMRGQAAWEMLYGDRPIEDIYERDEQGALVPMYRTIEPSAALILGAAKSLLPQIYGDKVEHTHQVNVGGVLRLGPTTPAPAISVPRMVEQPILDADYTMVLEDRALDDAPKPSNVLAVADRPETVEEYERTFGGRRITEAVLFYDELGALLPPSPGIIIVQGSKVHALYEAAGIAVETKTATELCTAGYCNEFLLKLANAEAAASPTTSTAPRRGGGGGRHITREDTPLVRDLRARLAEGVKNPRPNMPVNIGNKEPPGGDQADDRQAPRDPQHGVPAAALNTAGTGRGNVPPGGYRITR